MKKLFLSIGLLVSSMLLFADAPTISYTNLSGGTVTATPAGDFQYTLTASPATGYKFLYWLDDTTNTNLVRFIDYTDGKADYAAVFAKIEAVDQLHGQVAVTVKDETTPTFTLTASSSCGEFTKWSNESTEASIDYKEEDGDITPSFFARKVTEENEFNEGGTITIEEIYCGYRLTAVPAEGYRFVAWNTNATTATIDVEYPTADVDYAATFAPAGKPAKRGTTFYATIQEAIDAEGADPVEIIEDNDDNVTINKAVTINGENKKIGDLTIALNGDLTIGSNLTVKDLYLNTTTGASSQLRGEEMLTYDNAYVDVKLEANADVASPDLYYAMSVPFEVAIPEGIKRASAPNAATLVSGKDFLIWKYDGQMRAESQENGWVKLENGTLEPGKFYMLGIDGTENIWRFKANTSTLAAQTEVAMSAFESSSNEHSGWNAVANSALTYANASTTNSITYAQVYENGAAEANYQVKNFAETSFVVAAPFFIQTNEDDKLTFAAASHPAYAPANQTPSYYKVQLLLNNEPKDVIYLTTSEYADNEYTIGKDVAKMMGGNSHSYLYINAYDTKLCAHEMLMQNNTASCQLGLYAPEEATYVLSAPMMGEDELWLTQDGQPIWNLSEADYMLNLTQGTNDSYGLMVNHKAGVPTQFDAIHKASSTLKYLRNGRLFILVNGQTFDAQGLQY